METDRVKKIQDLVLNDSNFLSYINPFNNKNVSLQKKLDIIPSFIANKNRFNKISVKIGYTDINTSISSILSPDSKYKGRKIKNYKVNSLFKTVPMGNNNTFRLRSQKEINLNPLTIDKKYFTNYKLNFLKDYEKSFYFDNDYSYLHYNASEIFKGKSVYDKLILDKLNYLKQGKFDTKTVKFEKTIYYGKHRKEIKLTLNSLTISLEDMALSPEMQNKNLKLDLPISLLPLFYYKGLDSFQKVLATTVKVGNNFETISFIENEFETAINNIPDFKTNSSEEKVRSNNSKKLSTKKMKRIIKNECLMSPSLKRDQNFIKFNYFIFFWITNTRTFSAKITLPFIDLDILENHITMKLFLDYELLFFLYQKNFENWEFYVIKYLSTFSKYRKIFEQLGSQRKINHKTIFLKEPKTKINSFSQETLYNIYTDLSYRNQIILFNSFFINVQLIDDILSLQNNYKIIFNFNQYLKLFEIAKYSNKIDFLSKFMEINNVTHSLNFNFKKFDEFDVNLWMENMKKFSFSSLKNNNNINLNEELCNEYDIYNKTLRIEYKKPQWNLVKFENKKEVVRTQEIGNEMELHLIESIVNPNSWTNFLNICLEKIKESDKDTELNTLPKIAIKRKVSKNY